MYTLVSVLVNQSFLKTLPQENLDLQVSLLKQLATRRLAPEAALAYSEHLFQVNLEQDAYKFVNTHCLQFVRDLRGTTGKGWWEIEVEALLLRCRIMLGRQKIGNSHEFKNTIKDIKAC